MAESELAATAPEISPMEESEAPAATAEVSAVGSESPPPAEVTNVPQEEQAAAPALVASSEADESASTVADNKRKLDNLEQPREEPPEEKQGDSVAAPDKEAPIAPIGEETGLDAEAKAPDSTTSIPRADLADAAPAKRQRLDEEADGTAVVADQEAQKLEATPVGNGQTIHHASAENLDTSNDSVSQEGKLASAGQQLLPSEVSCKFEVPNNKVGVLIGKAGETIRSLQQNSGAKIQITRDAQADPNSSTRPVELIGTPESVRKAEQLIKDVIKEAEAGGSPALVARGFGNGQSGSEQQEIQVPNEKVGMIIGKGGETIKNLQTQSGARIQLIPQHLPEGDASTERTVRITGNKRQIEAAKNMIKEVMAQGPGRPSHLSGGFSQSRPRAASSLNQWGSRAPAPAQQVAGYDYQQRGMYPPQSTQHHSQSYGSYAQQPPPRSSMNTSWDQRAAAPIQTGGYDYYAHGGQSSDTQLSNPVPAQSAGPVNYNYGQPQVASYGQPTPYPQSAAPTQQNYGHGFNEQKYDNQTPGQQYYGQQPVNSQPGAYAPQGGTPQVDYAQQQAYNKPAYGNTQQSYGPPRANQPGDAATYQGATPTAYGAAAPTQQPYPYGQSAPQSAPGYGQAYGPTSGAVDGYTQPSSVAGYPQQSGQVTSGYGQQTPAYAQQGAQSSGYGQYPSSQPNYGDQPAANSVNYGYQGGSADAGYGGNNVPSSGYGSAPVGNQAAYGQPGYVQPQSYPPGYEQQMPIQSGYGSQPGAAPAGYTKGLSPQPGYGGQYDSAQMYGQH